MHVRIHVHTHVCALMASKLAFNSTLCETKGADTLNRNVPLAYYGAFQAPSLPIGPLQGALGTQSVLAIPKGEPPAKAGFPLGSPGYIISCKLMCCRV